MRFAHNIGIRIIDSRPNDLGGINTMSIQRRNDTIQSLILIQEREEIPLKPAPPPLKPCPFLLFRTLFQRLYSTSQSLTSLLSILQPEVVAMQSD